MENQKLFSFEISCPQHPSETIQRVALDKYVNQHLYCLECLLQPKSHPREAPTTLKPISELIDTAASLYAKKRENASFREPVPSEMTEILTGQAEKLEAFTQHIEEEKKRVSSLFDSIVKKLLKTIEEKKTEAFAQLDQQIFNLQSMYMSFGKQLRKTYPTPEDIPILYPTKEDLLNKLAKITNATQLTALVKNIKDDLNETTTSSLKANDRAFDLKKKAVIRNMGHQLLRTAKMRPFYHREFFDIQKLKQGLIEKVSDFYLMKQPCDTTPKATKGIEGSAFLAIEDFDLIKSWLPQNLTFDPQLLYRGTRDGMDGSSFHEFCDGKENTITVIKAKLRGSETVSILGGYLDKPWHSKGFIKSTDAFLFSLTKNIKCLINNKKGQYAACGYENQGPSFGDGYDLAVWTLGTSSFVCPHSYQNSNQLVGGPEFSGGQAFMDVLEVEVYSVN